MKRGFDSSIYIKEQKKKIIQRIRQFDKLYLEFGGKLCYDLHASRVLPGYHPSNKINILHSLPNKEIIYCTNAIDIQNGRMMNEKISYEDQVFKDLQNLISFGLKVSHLVINRFSNQSKAISFSKKISKKGIPLYFHKEIPEYTKDVKKALLGFKNQPYIPTKKSLIIVTGTASGSGKMSVALSQIYHERKRGIKSGFAKSETFPIWNLPITHPINIAYEAATADLQDFNMIDPYHKRYYGKTAVNYNRDIENFKILMKISYLITKEKSAFGYMSPTDMGINMAKKGIINEKECIKASEQEIVRRYYHYLSNFKKGKDSIKTIRRMKEILKKANLSIG